MKKNGFKAIHLIEDELKKLNSVSINVFKQIAETKELSKENKIDLLRVLAEKIKVARAGFKTLKLEIERGIELMDSKPLEIEPLKEENSLQSKVSNLFRNIQAEPEPEPKPEEEVFKSTDVRQETEDKGEAEKEA